MTQIKKLKLATEGTENAEERIKIKLSGLCELGGEEKNMEMKRKNESRNTNHEPSLLTKGRGEPRLRVGSALILAVVLTSLLAIVGVMFVMVARVDRIATSAISENKELNSAVEAVIARISQELVLDVPGVSTGNRDYHDYPGPEDKWLASLEPYEKTAGNYYWRQISDVYNRFANLELDTEIIPDHQDNVNEGLQADADGDGVADSRWVEIDDMTSSKGKPIYAAIRVIDNGAMLNVNTAYKFDPTESRDRIDGSSQTQINLAALSQRGANGSLDNAADDLQDERCGTEPTDLSLYEEKVVWRYYVPDGEYTPFDISDELELRNRYTLNREDIDSRIEEVWDNAFQWPNAGVPIGTGSLNLDEWLGKVQYDWSEPNAPNDYSYRHIGTTYNMDRIIHPYGGRMVNVNRDVAGYIYSAIKQGIDVDPNFYDVNDIAAQTAVNLIDFRDNDSNVATFDPPPPGGKTYYGFERPCVYISELAHRFVEPDIGISPLPDSFVYKSYGIELYKPYVEDDYPDANQWQLVIEDYKTETFPVDWSDAKSFHVMLFEHQGAPLDVNSNASLDRKQLLQSGVRVFRGGKTISLQRLVGTDWITVDSETVPYSWDVIGGWLEPLSDGIARSIQRDITLHKCIRRLWDSGVKAPTLGSYNAYETGDSVYIQAHPANEDFTNVGEIGMVFRKDVYRRNWDSTNTEADVRINLADPNYHSLFQYLTVFDPATYPWNVPNETRIKGRININTAPWYVIAQLPWVSYDEDNPGTADYRLAQAIVAYRDKAVIPDQNNINYDDRYAATDIDGLREEPGFASIGELATVVNNSGEDEYSMHYYELDSNDLEDFPDLTPNDDAADDFEERDVIFARLSNLVTVRSDVFTAYILVRIGADGPQKRVMAILDRSNVYPPEGGKVRIVALHPVADPR